MDLIHTLKELKKLPQDRRALRLKEFCMENIVRNSQEKVGSSSNGSVRLGENHQSDHSI